MLRGLCTLCASGQRARDRHCNQSRAPAPLSINLQTRTPLPLPAYTHRPAYIWRTVPPPNPRRHTCARMHFDTGQYGVDRNLISLIVSVVCPTALSLPFSITWLGNSESVEKGGEREACASFVARPLVFEKEEKNFFFFHVSLLSWKEIFGDFRR